jgi:hypothetical protein
MSELHDIRNYLAQDGILVCFNGPFRHSIIEELGKAVRTHLETEAVRKSAMADVFEVFIEATQNVANYANRAAWDEGLRVRIQNGILVVARKDGRYEVRCGNFVRPGDGAALVARLDELAGLDAPGLKARFKERMRAPVAPGEGAGLGLIRMARTASVPLAYGLVPEDGDVSFFSLTVTL